MTYDHVAYQGAAANVRPAFRLEVLGHFGRGLCAQLYRSAHVADRWATLLT